MGHAPASDRRPQRQGRESPPQRVWSRLRSRYDENRSWTLRRHRGDKATTSADSREPPWVFMSRPREKLRPSRTAVCTQTAQGACLGLTVRQRGRYRRVASGTVSSWLELKLVTSAVWFGMSIAISRGKLPARIVRIASGWPASL